MTAMGIKRRVQATQSPAGSFLLDDDESDEDEPTVAPAPPVPEVRRSATSLEEALVTQDLGVPTEQAPDSDEESVGALRRVAQDIQQRALQRADELRASLDSLGSDGGAELSSLSNETDRAKEKLLRLQSLAR